MTSLDSFSFGLGHTTSAGSDDSADLTSLAFLAELVESVSSVHGNASSSVELSTLVFASDSHGLGLCSSGVSSSEGAGSSSGEELSSSDLKLLSKSGLVLLLKSQGSSLLLLNDGTLGGHHLGATAGTATAGIRVGV